MSEVAIFGAGYYGKRAAMICMKKGEKVAYFVDNACEKIGKKMMGVDIINLDRYAEMSDHYDLLIAVNVGAWKSIEVQLKEKNISNYSFFNLKELGEKERLISFSEKRNLEDVILYHALKDEKEIFYIDVGSNDPFEHSVTKLLYDMKAAHGINIEPQQNYFELLERERPRDINLCVGLGEVRRKERLYFQGGSSSIVQENVMDREHTEFTEIDIVTLKEVCETYLGQNTEISVLKIDVEGAEKYVLEGADFEKYRPWIVEVESTKPNTDIPSHDEWEELLLSNDYHFVMMIGVNRYYVADEKSYLDERLCSVEELNDIYKIYYAEITI